jgi:hypothetical protein
VARCQCKRSYLNRYPDCTAVGLVLHAEVHWPEYLEWARFLLGFIQHLDREARELEQADPQPEEGPEGHRPAGQDAA